VEKQAEKEAEDSDSDTEVYEVGTTENGNEGEISEPDGDESEKHDNAHDDGEDTDLEDEIDTFQVSSFGNAVIAPTSMIQISQCVSCMYQMTKVLPQCFK
jgi:hypothetical protein